MIALDDNIEDHPKFVGLSNDAFALWVRCIGYCRRNLTDGLVPEPVAIARARCKAPKKAIAELLTPPPGGRTPLWHQVPGGYQVHDYLEWNPSKAEVEAKREQKRSAGRTGGEASGEARKKRIGLRGSSGPEANAKHGASDSLPDRVASGSYVGTPVPVPVPVPVPEKILPEPSSPLVPPGGPPPGRAGDDVHGVVVQAMRAHRKLAGMDLASIALDVAEGLAAARIADPRKTKTAEDIVRDIGEAVVQLPESPNEQTARARIHAFVVRGGWNRRPDAPPRASGNRGDTPQNTLTPEYLARVQAVHDLHVADVEARVAAEKALPAHQRDVFGPDYEDPPEEAP